MASSGNTDGLSIDELSRRKSVRGPPIIVYLADDVLINILSRLHVKSLLRFKCVSKSWMSLMSFPSLQAILSTAMDGLFYSFFQSSTGKCQFRVIYIEDISLPNTNNVAISEVGDFSFFPYHHHHNFCIVNCCNGLLLGQGLKPITSNTLAYYVINPATKKWVALPHAPKNRTRTNCMLAFDPLVSRHYTLICWGLFSGVDIFSSKTGLWVHSEVPQELATQPQRRSPAPPAVFLNRTLHMLSKRNSIVGFDLDVECFRLIPLPGPMPNYMQKCLGVSGGHLYYANYDDYQLQIWMLEEYDDRKWVLKHQITINFFVEKRPQTIRRLSFGREYCVRLNYYRNNFSFLAFHPDFEVVFLGMGGTLFSYHLKSMKLEEVLGLNLEHIGIYYWQCVYPFSPCLADFYDCEW